MFCSLQEIRDRSRSNIRSYSDWGEFTSAFSPDSNPIINLALAASKYFDNSVSMVNGRVGKNNVGLPLNFVFRTPQRATHRIFLKLETFHEASAVVESSTEN